MNWRKSSCSYSNGNCAEVAAWRTSAHSGGASCAEVAAWRKSSASAANGECTEVGQGTAVVGVRDSRDPGGPVLEFSTGAWAAFTVHLKSSPG